MEVAAASQVGADVAKIANTATDIADVARMVALPATQPGLHAPLPRRFAGCRVAPRPPASH